MGHKQVKNYGQDGAGCAPRPETVAAILLSLLPPVTNADEVYKPEPR